MPNAILTPDGAILDAARAFVPLVADSSDRIEAERRIPQELIDGFREAGLLRLYLPTAFGGSEANPFTVIRVAEILAMADASTAWCVNVANQAAWLTSRLSPEQAGDLINRDSILLGSGMPAGEATPVNSGYRLSGRWTFASGAPHATVFSAVVPQPGAAPGSPNLLTFLPRADCEVLDTWYTTGMRGTGSHDFEVKDAFVPEGLSYISGIPSKHPSPLYAVPYLRFIGRGGLALGVARRTLDAFAGLALEKKPFGAGSRLADQERIQIGLAEAEATYGSARAWLFEATAQLWELMVSEGDAPHAVRAQVALANAHAAQSALKAVQDVYRMGGTSSTRTTWILDRCLRDLLTVAADGSIGSLVVAGAGRAVLGVGPGAPF